MLGNESEIGIQISAVILNAFAASPKTYVARALSCLCSTILMFSFTHVFTSVKYEILF